MNLVQTVTVGAGGAASIEFTNIPQTGQDLLIVCSPRNVSPSSRLVMRINSNSSTIYSWRNLNAYPGTVLSATDSAQTYLLIGQTSNSDDSASTFGNTAIYIPNYAGSANKSIGGDSVTETNGTFAYQQITAGLAATTSAVTSIQLGVGNFSNNFAQYSTASLYTISTTGATGATVS